MENEPLSSLTHFIAALLSVAGLTLLVVLATLHSTAWHIVGFSVFGASLILLYTASAVFHFLRPGKAKDVFRRIDHSMIYVLIAGTYTPICLTILRGGWGWSLFGLLWGFALLGIVVKSTNLPLKPLPSTITYLVMGWLAVIAFNPLQSQLSTSGLWWLFGGGMFYTVGTIFYALDKKIPRTRWFGMHELWHVFVMLGSFSHFWLMLKHVI